MKGIIKVNSLSMAYDGVPVFEDLSFSVDTGDLVFIVGNNGAGKSTLIKGILGLMKIKSGDIRFSGIERRDIGYLSQDSIVKKDFPASVWEIVLSGTLGRKGLFPFYTAEDKKTATRSLETLSVAHLKNKCFYELSGGQQQRVLLSRALSSASKVLILDEPVKGLDAASAESMYEAVKELTDSGKMTVLMVSHDLSAAKKYATHILKISENGSVFAKARDYFSGGGRMI